MPLRTPSDSPSGDGALTEARNPGAAFASRGGFRTAVVMWPVHRRCHRAGSAQRGARFVINEAGLVVTNKHVAGTSDEVSAEFVSGAVPRPTCYGS